MFTKPLSELSDTELLDVLDLVSAEVKRRNSLSFSPEGEDEGAAIKRAAEYFSTMVQQSVTHR